VIDESTETLLCSEDDEDEDEDDGAGAEETGADVEGVVTWDVPEEAAGSEGVGV
jgi:hypothetical protein